MLKGVIFGLIWGIVTISLMVVAIGLGIPPETEREDAVAASEEEISVEPARNDPMFATAERPSLLTDEPEDVASITPEDIPVASGDAGNTTPPAQAPTEPAAEPAASPGAEVASLPEAPDQNDAVVEASPIPTAETSAEPAQVAAVGSEDAAAVVPAPDAPLPDRGQPQAVEGGAPGENTPVAGIDLAASPRPVLNGPDTIVAPAEPSDVPAVAAAADTAPAAVHAPLTEPVTAEAAVVTSATEPAVPPLPVPVAATEAPLPGPADSVGDTSIEVAALPDGNPSQEWRPAPGTVSLNTQDVPETAPRSDQPASPSNAVNAVPRKLPQRIELEAEGTTASEGAISASAGSGTARTNGETAERTAASAGIEAESKTGFRRVVTGVRTDRLPTIAGGTPTGATAAQADTTLPSVTIPAAGETPLARNARPFDNQAGLPMIAIVLTPAEGGVDAGTVQSLSFPVAVALDPLSAEAGGRAGEYKAAGAEVLILAGALPKGATASDVEVSFAGYFGTIGNAVGVIDRPEGGFAAEMLQAKQVATILADEGYGMVTYARGLNSAAREAARLGLPAVQVSRVLDEDATDPQALRRTLDRAAFDASQSGGIVLTAAALPENVAAIAAWVQDARGVTIAPVSAVLGGE